VLVRGVLQHMSCLMRSHCRTRPLPLLPIPLPNKSPSASPTCHPTRPRPCCPPSSTGIKSPPTQVPLPALMHTYTCCLFYPTASATGNFVVSSRLQPYASVTTANLCMLSHNNRVSCTTHACFRLAHSVLAIAGPRRWWRACRRATLMFPARCSTTRVRAMAAHHYVLL